VPDEYVFGYGSLLERRALKTARVGHLTGYRRAWNVARDNSLDFPGYNHYIDPRDGSRPDVFVVFLNLVPARDGRVNGLLFPVTEPELAVLDRRERNYRRIDVTDQIEEQVDGRIWTYIGLDEAVARFKQAVNEKRAVIRRGYYDGVLANCAAAGTEARQEFDECTDAPTCPIIDLERVESD
jgi:cation transport regulator ChaC